MVAESRGLFVYAPPAQIKGEQIALTPEEAHHLRQVRRIAAGTEIFVTDGAGMVYRGLTGGDDTIKILERLPNLGEPNVSISLFVGMLKGDDNRDVVDCATQMGVRRIIFIKTIRSEGRIRENKLARLERATVSAIKQCGRSWLPEILVSQSVQEALSLRDRSAAVYLAQQTDVYPQQGDTDPFNLAGQKADVFVGPEGGFDEEEFRMVLAAGAKKLSLGQRRLRTGIAVAAALQYLGVLSSESQCY
jgi:16S rRNA (uracil1498-N3)-methyltransferase